MRSDHREIEHKFLVPEGFDVDALGARLVAAGAGAAKRLTVRDTYFWRDDLPGAVFRHRIDRELHQLTVKSSGADAAVRTEVNLDLSGPDAADTVAAFLAAGWGPCRRFRVAKEICVWEPGGFEVVHYVATGEQGRIVRCVEFEAVGDAPPERALEALEAFEARFGFDPRDRCRASLFHLMTASDAQTTR